MEIMSSPKRTGRKALTPERRPEVHITRARWLTLLGELARRAEGTRESGAFLLARVSNPNNVIDIAYYDDLDPACLTGGISFSGLGYSRLWAYCRRRGMAVIADVHTHPGTVVRQSDIDASNPMISHRGHIAIIVPNLGLTSSPHLAGVHVYQGNYQWKSYEGEQNRTVLHVDGSAASAIRRMVKLVGQFSALARTAISRCTKEGIRDGDRTS